MPAEPKKSILLIDDCPVILGVLSEQFSAEFNVDTVESGEEAVALLESSSGKNRFDLIVTDLKMPGMDGFELARYVRERNRVEKFTPVIMLTSENVSKEEARKSGCAACFLKPERERLLSMVRILLSLY
ncbi:MAG: response regulator [Desulfuromonadales bacterium]|nr:response regulator [Desulfuromonadales bacterium]